MYKHYEISLPYNNLCVYGMHAMLLQLANLLGYQHTAYLVKTNFTRYMAQPFMQLHAKWMQVSHMQEKGLTQADI